MYKIIFIVVGKDGRYKYLLELSFNCLPKIDEVFNFGGFPNYKVISQESLKIHDCYVYLVDKF
jgi:hypothetical protein